MGQNRFSWFLRQAMNSKICISIGAADNKCFTYYFKYYFQANLVKME